MLSPRLSLSWPPSSADDEKLSLDPEEEELTVWMLSNALSIKPPALSWKSTPLKWMPTFMLLLPRPDTR